MTMMSHNYRSRQFQRTSMVQVFGPWARPFGTNGQITKMLHNYRSRRVQETLNGVNPSSAFRDMRSTKSGPNMWHIWQVFGPWASPYGANGQMIMTAHNYRPRQFHRTSNGDNPSSGYRDTGSASLVAARLAPPAGGHPPAQTVMTIPLQPGRLRGKKEHKIISVKHPDNTIIFFQNTPVLTEDTQCLIHPWFVMAMSYHVLVFHYIIGHDILPVWMRYEASVVSTESDVFPSSCHSHVIWLWQICYIRNFSCINIYLHTDIYRKLSNIRFTKSPNLIVSHLGLQLSLHNTVDWSHVLSREWRCSWSSAGRRCSNYIGVTNNLIAY